jgi:uncharacterized protein with von Willebrand factor type A (vWA) domain
MADPLANGVHELIVTGPERDRLFERFAHLYAGRADVVVIKDRREIDRHRESESNAERHRRERRRRAAWLFPPD